MCSTIYFGNIEIETVGELEAVLGGKLFPSEHYFELKLDYCLCAVDIPKSVAGKPFRLESDEDGWHLFRKETEVSK